MSDDISNLIYERIDARSSAIRQYKGKRFNYKESLQRKDNIQKRDMQRYEA